MLYARCSFCGAVQSVLCSGGFAMHMPMPVEATPMGARCSGCGGVLTAFMCGYCGAQQFLTLPGAVPSYSAASPGQMPMQAVQAPANASKSSIVGEFAKSFGEGFGKGAAQTMFGQSG